MNLGEFRKQTEGMPDDIEIFVRPATNPCGNIIEADRVAKDTYGFFGKTIPCLIVEPEDPA